MSAVRSLWAGSKLYRGLLIAAVVYFLLRLGLQMYLFAYAITPEAIAEGTLVSGDLQFSYIPAAQHFQARQDIYLKGYADGGEARLGIGTWIDFYNLRRPHQALGNRTPMAVWRAGTTGARGATAVDMTLRLDNARALSTCPQPPQQQQVHAIV